MGNFSFRLKQDSKRGCKNWFLRRPFSKHTRFQAIVGGSNKGISVHFFILWDNQGWQNRGLKMFVLVKPLHKLFKRSDKNFNFFILINIYVEYKFQAVMWVRGPKIGAQTGDIKMDFKKELLKKTLYFKIWWSYWK